MIEVSEAVERILARIEPLPGETVATASAVGRVLAESVAAPITSPPWDNSSMDGYAARAEDLSPGATLRVVESIAAGSFPSRPIGPGEAARIMTGAPVPKGADSVVRHEDTDNGLERVVVHDTRDAGRNIRKAGEDFAEGDQLLTAGTQLTVRHVGVLASATVRHVAVHRRPRVAVISSGDELVALEDFSAIDRGRKIVSANSLTMSALVRDAGGEPVDLGIAKDDPADLRAKLELAHDADLIVTTAGISVGDHDHVRTVFAALGGELDFWKVRMRPGAPLGFGHLDGVPWVGLSGNPVSAIVTFELFVRAAIRKMLGAKDLYRQTIPVVSSEPLKLAASLMHFLRVVLTPDQSGSFVATLAGSQSSAVLTALARADALLIVPGDRLDYAAGEKFRALPFENTFRYSGRLELA
jgi:molybdopterin molybdotransferase